MADSTGKVTSGAPFRAPPATVWNNMIDAGQAFAAEKLSSGSPGATRPRATDLLSLKNSSGDVRRKGDILKIEGKVIETIADETIWLDGIEPTADCRFGILKSPADADEVVTAQVSGVCMALVNVTDAGHTFASAADADYVLQSGDSGPLEILYAPSGTGELECVVRFGGGGGASAVGRATSAITPADDSLAGTSFTFRRFVVDDSDSKPKTLKEEDDDSDGVNRFKHLSAGVDAIVIVHQINGEWTVSAAEDVCPD
mgnify:CR=1 FL=1